MLDKNGKLFGKVSIIDLSFIILLLAAAVFTVYKLGILSPKQIITGNTNKLRITFYQEEVNTFTANNVKSKDPVSETLFNTSLGNVVDYKMDKSVSWGRDRNGKQVLSTKDGFSSVYITMEVSGVINSNGIIIGGSRYYIGQLMILRVGTSIFYGRINDTVKV